MNTLSTTHPAPPDAAEPYRILIARLWATGTNSADIARILDLEEAAVERIRIEIRDTSAPRAGGRDAPPR